MKKWLSLFSVLYLLASCAQKAIPDKEDFIEKFKYGITMTELDIPNLDSGFGAKDNKSWLVNQVQMGVVYAYKESLLAKRWPNLFISKRNIPKLNALLADTAYMASFQNTPRFAYGMEFPGNLNLVLPLFTLGDSSLSFLENDFQSIRMDSLVHTNQWVIEVKLKDAAAGKLLAFTTRNANRQVAILINDVVYSCPNLSAPLSTGAFQIVTDYSKEELRHFLNGDS